MNFYYRIGKKPRGNWRPKIEFGYSWKKEEVAHNPKTEHLVLSSEKCRRFFETTPVGINVAVLPSKFKGDFEPWELYDNPKKGHAGCRSSVHAGQGSNLYVLDSVYKKDYADMKYVFYAPWKPGAKPDYSEIVPVMLEIKDWIELMLTDGLESGESDEINGNMVLSEGEWFGTGMEYVKTDENKNVVIDKDGRQRLIRHLDF